jgi:hypothetical protein
MARAAGSFYPIFPVPYDTAHDVNLDMSHSALLEIVDSAPDVLVLPSRLKHFSKVRTPANAFKAAIDLITSI